MVRFIRYAKILKENPMTRGNVVAVNFWHLTASNKYAQLDCSHETGWSETSFDNPCPNEPQSQGRTFFQLKRIQKDTKHCILFNRSVVVLYPNGLTGSFVILSALQLLLNKCCLPSQCNEHNWTKKEQRLTLKGIPSEKEFWFIKHSLLHLGSNIKKHQFFVQAPEANVILPFCIFIFIHSLEWVPAVVDIYDFDKTVPEEQCNYYQLEKCSTRTTTYQRGVDVICVTFPCSKDTASVNPA